jgi:hypothetical protein
MIGNIRNDEKPQVREWWRRRNIEHNQMEHNSEHNIDIGVSERRNERKLTKCGLGDRNEIERIEMMET